MYVWYIVFKKCWKNIVVSVEVKLVIEKFFFSICYHNKSGSYRFQRSRDTQADEYSSH